MHIKLTLFPTFSGSFDQKCNLCESRFYALITKIIIIGAKYLILKFQNIFTKIKKKKFYTALLYFFIKVLMKTLNYIKRERLSPADRYQ